jgi:toxin ParE1/3/4
VIPVFFSEKANADLEGIEDYIALDSATTARRILLELRRRVIKIGYMPGGYPPRSDLGPGIRVMIWSPYLVLFHVVGETVEVLRVVHGAQDLRETLKR